MAGFGSIAQVEIRNLNCLVGQTTLVSGVDLNVFKGTILTLIGRSGSGKTSLLRCLAGLENCTAERFVVPKPLGLVFQGSNLFSHLTLEENVTIALIKVKNMSKASAVARARAVLDQVQLSHRRDWLPLQLSGGEQQRGAIARTLAMDPQVILYDEPTSALDPELSIEIYDIMRELRRQGLIQIMVSHDVNVVRGVADVIGYMRQSRLRWCGPAEQLSSSLKELDSAEQKYLNLYF
jgi:polar amino acid transport system ATP-binding protein